MYRRQWLIGAAACISVAGCRTAPPQVRSFPDPSFLADGVFQLDVAQIEVVSTYQAPLVLPNVEHRFPVTPSRMLQRWASERLVPTGFPDRKGRFIIEDASVRENEIARQGGIRGAFTNQQAQLYEGAVRATLEILDPLGLRRDAFASASAARSQSVAENASVADREQAWGQLCTAMMSGFNTEMDRQIRANLAPFVR